MIVPLFTAVIATAAMASACSDSTDEGEDGLTTGEQTVDLAAGEDLYAQSCASCHGADLRGTSRGPSHLSQVYEPGHHSDDSFRSAVANGSPQHHWQFGDMPPVEGLDDDEVDAVIAFIRDAQQREGFEPYPPE